jgi:molybdopterin-guanine dinucleotide biosynthesis protein B
MMRLISVVGQSGAGKTTFIEKLVPELKRRGLRVAVVKHHAHDTPLDAPGKDSWRFAEAGADAVLVSSPVEFARFERPGRELSLAEIAARLDGFDLILTEGFKRESAPKIELSRAAVSTALLCREEDLLAVVCDYAAPTSAPRFALDDAAGVADLIMRS